MPKPSSVIGLAAGRTPCLLYQLLGEACAAGEVDFSQVRTFSLDEYVGLGTDHPQSYRYFMEKRLFSRVNLSAAHIAAPDGMAADIAAE